MEIFDTFDDGGINPIDTIIMNSTEKLTLLIDEFEKYIKAGYSPDYCQEEIYQKLGIDIERDLLPNDINYLTKKVREMYFENYKKF